MTDKLQSKGFVLDLHSDILTDIARRRVRGENKVFLRRHFNRLVNNGIKSLVTVIWVEPYYRQYSHLRFMQLLGSLLADLGESEECVTLVTDEISLAKAHAQGKIGVFLGVEGMTFVEKWPLLQQDQEKEMFCPDNFDDPGLLLEKLEQSLALLTKIGMRHAILAWGEKNSIASGPGKCFSPPDDQRGLTPFGREVVKKLEDHHVVIDLSHLDDRSIGDVLAISKGPLMASHSNARSLCNVARNLSDDHIREIGRRNGVIGLNAYHEFVNPHSATIDNFIDHIIYIADMIGIDGVAFGFDFTDYLHGSNKTRSKEVELDRVEDVPRLIIRLAERGFSANEIEKITHVNALRVMAKSNEGVVSCLP